MGAIFLIGLQPEREQRVVFTVRVSNKSDGDENAPGHSFVLCCCYTDVTTFFVFI